MRTKRKEKQMGGFKRFAAMMLSFALLVGGIAPSAYAAGDYTVTYTTSETGQEFIDALPKDTNTYGEGDTVTLLRPSKEEITEDQGTLYFKGWMLNGTLITDSEIVMGTENIVLEALWQGTIPPPLPPEYIKGNVYEHDFDKAESTGTPKSGADLTVLLKDDEESTITSESDGSFNYLIPEEKRKDDKEYSYSIEKDATHLGSSGTVKGNEDASIYIKKRYVAKDSDWTLPNQENAENGVIKEAGTYTIEGTGSNRLSKTLDGEPSKSIEVSIDENGNVEPFFVYPDDTCSVEYSSGTVDIDSDAPLIQNVSTAPGDNKTYVKTHGIYAQKKANLLINATIKDTGAGLDEVYLLGKKDGTETRYEASRVDGKDGQYKAVIGLPGEETLLDAETVYLVAVDKFGNKTEKLIAKTEQGSQVVIELIAPEISKEITPDANSKGWHNTLPTVKAKAKDENSGLEEISIYQDGKRIAHLSITDEREKYEKTLEGKIKIDTPSKDGSYKLKIVAKDNAGNLAEDEFTLKVDLKEPVLSFKGVEAEGNYSKMPAVRIEEEELYPGANGNKVTAVVYKNDSKEGQTFTFEKVSEAIIPAETFKDDARYRIEVNATDAAGNKAEKKSIRFIHDATKPSVSIGPMSQPNKNGWYNSLPTVSATVSDYMSGLRVFTISEDNLALYNQEYKTAVKKMQTSNVKAVINNPSDNGSYKFTAFAEDYAGNTASKDLTLKIDLVAPVLSTSGVSNGTHYRGAPSIKISENEKYYAAKGAFIRYRIYRDGKLTIDRTLSSVNAASIPAEYFGQDGNYTLYINSSDAAGNNAKPLTYKFVKDGTAPVLSLSGASNGEFYNTAKRITLEVVERWFETNNVTVTATRELHGNRENVGFPWSNDGYTSFHTATFSDVGTYTVTASAVDKAGNRGEARSLTVTVDQKAPEIEITGVSDGAVYTYGQGVAPRVKITDDYPGTESIVYTKGGEVITNPNFEQTKENDGSYTLTVTATDKAGNTTTRVVNFVINRFGSYFVYPDATKDVMGKAIQSLDKDVSILEHNVSKLEKSEKTISRDGKKLEAVSKTTEKLGAKENVYTHTFDKGNFAEEGKYELNVVSKDEAGNEMESKEENGPVVFYIDRTAPSISISGINPKGNKGDTATLQISISELLTGVKEVKATVDGKEVSLSENEDKSLALTLKQGLNQEIEISATDGAGNIGTASDIASVSSNALSLFLNRFLWPVIGGILAALAALLFFIFGKRRKKEKEEGESAA